MNKGFSKADVIATCEKHGKELHVPKGIDGQKLMYAFALVESSGGIDCGPRYESSYDIGGWMYRHSVLQQQLITKYGRSAACSYGPWQMMFVNFKNITPTELSSNLELLATNFVQHFNLYVINIKKANTIEQMGEVWNLGHIGKDPIYVQKLLHSYNTKIDIS